MQTSSGLSVIANLNTNYFRQHLCSAEESLTDLRQHGGYVTDDRIFISGSTIDITGENTLTFFLFFRLFERKMSEYIYSAFN